ncbi:Ion transport protein-domain-containing protein [Lipomyces kononenkoae]|uniref:Ion transport protein-domain-containing protein n=1 Tax=Lipomyces kononenkoae TaxID=34357 RepID=A0ACC3SUX2_LIPKO
MASPHSDEDIPLEEVDIGDEDIEASTTLRPFGHVNSLTPPAIESASGSRKRGFTATQNPVGPALLTSHERRESIPMRWHTIGGRQSFATTSELIDDGRTTSPSRDSAVDQMRVVQDGLSDVLARSGVGSWLPIRQVPEQQASVIRRRTYTSVDFADQDDDTVSLMPHLQVVRSGSSGSQQRHQNSLSVNVNFDRLGDDLADAETGTVHSSDSLPSPSQLTADGARSMARNISSAVRRVVSNERRPSREETTSVDMDRITLATDENYTYSPVDSLNPSLALDVETESSIFPVPLAESRPPLQGKSLGIFSGDNRLRVIFYQIVSHQAFEIFAFVLMLIQTLVLTYRAVHALDSANSGWGHHWPDYALLIIFCFYTIETIIKIIVSGFFLNPATDTHQFIFELLKRWHVSHNDKNDMIIVDEDTSLTPQPTFTTKGSSIVMTVSYQNDNHLSESGSTRIARLAYLRSTWNRIDFSCVVFYWIYLIIATSSSENKSTAVNVFRALSALRILKWMKLTNGTATVLDSIKVATPALANVSIFISVFCTLFALVGIQAFSGSFRRQCVWVDPYQQEANYTNNLQFCGGYLDPVDKSHLPWVRANGEPGTTAPKGFICPVYSICVELDENVYSNTVSFDNILQSLELVFVVLGTNGFSDLMNYTAESDHLAASLFFVAGIIILGWWMFSLFIAVISTSFAVTREMKDKERSLKERNQEKVAYTGRDTKLMAIYKNIEPAVVLLIFMDFVIECCKSSTMSERLSRIIYDFQVITTIVLLVEILFRFAASFPDWREFFLLPQNAKNYIDLLLVIVTCVILIPPIKSSTIAYPWLSFFQVARIYRVVVAIKFTRQNWLIVTRKARNLSDLVVFLLLMLYICSLIASELLRGNIPQEYEGQSVTISFYNMANSFAGVYQILTTEGWANVLYTITGSLSGTALAWVGAIFICGWFFFANSVVVNLFIAAIQENFDISEEEKRLRQIVAYADNYKPTELGDGPTSMFESMAGDRRRKSSTIPMQYAARQMLHSEETVAGFLLSDSTTTTVVGEESPTSNRTTVFSFDYWKEKFTIERHSNPFYFHPSFKFEEMKDANKFVKKVLLIKTAHKKVREKYIRDHPNFNRVLFCLRPESRLRRFCQTIVGPTHGTRYNGANRNHTLSGIFSAIIMICVAGSVIVACISTPFYEKNYYERHGCNSDDSNCGTWSWMTYSDISFAAIFTVEAAIKIIADGFVYTPNAYIWSTWNAIDFFVVVTLWIEIITSLLNRGINVRFLRAFKAFRALRLLHVNDAAKNTFHTIIIVGLGKIVGAAIVSLTLLLPFSLWGLNIFMGTFDSCTDGNVNELSTCTGEFPNSVYNWNFWMPRSYNNPGYSFDDFSQSLSILFQIISLEGWNNVLQTAEDVVGVGLNQQTNNSVYNGIFVYLFNFISIAFIATLFITVIMQNYAMKTGVGFLTSKQRAFVEIQKILQQVRPSRTGQKPRNRFRRYCYNRTVARDGSWTKYVAIVLLIQGVVLCSEYYPSNVGSDRVRDAFYLVTSGMLVVYFIFRLVGLPWSSYRLHYQRNAWDIFWFAIVLSSFALNLATMQLEDGAKEYTIETVKRLLLVASILMLIPYSDRLSRLFVSTSASLPAILNLLFTWFVLFVVYAIAFNQVFGLTRIGPNGSTNINFRTIPKALLLLFRMSCGEGWNSVMLDYTIQSPYCVESSDFFSSDCGSSPYAYLLFFSWNIISMYIFANMFISLVYESFSYVYQQSYISDSNGGEQFGQFASRGTIRAYKDAWDRIDENGTGYIPKSKVGKLLRSLPHPLNVHIYESPYTYPEILERSKISARRHNHGRLVGDIDIDAMDDFLRNIDTDKVRAARGQYRRMYEEIMMSEVAGHGIPFSAPLTIIPYYKIENAEIEAVTLDQYILRRSRLKALDEQIKRKLVQDFYRMISARARFLRQRNVSLWRPSAAVPTIIIESVTNRNDRDNE